MKQQKCKLNIFSRTVVLRSEREFRQDRTTIYHVIYISTGFDFSSSLKCVEGYHYNTLCHTLKYSFNQMP